MSNESLLRTPTKRLHPDELDPANMTSPKFIKPSDVFRKRAKRSHKNSPTKSYSTTKRGTLPLETVVKNYSPLKCLQSFKSPTKGNNASTCSLVNNDSKKPLTFSPLMKKLQRSPARSALHFPVVKRGGAPLTGSATKSSGSLKRPLNGNTFSRVLDFSEDANFFPEKFESSFSTSPSKVGTSKFYPLNAPHIDWSLKTKLRITTNRAIPFHGSFKAIDEACGLSHFVHGVNSADVFNMDNFSAELHRHCLVWQHPSIPWIKLFPRTPDLKPGSQVSSTTPVFAISATSTLADSLHSDFCSSLHSLFKLLKLKHCPYFYMCANNFTVIFRASGVAGSNDAHALITPTTLGFRKLLKDEGIEYTMPFHDDSSTQNASDSSSENSSSSGIGTSESSDFTRESSECLESIDDEDAMQVNPEENDEWLESLGLSQQDFPSLESISLRRRRMMKSKFKSRKNGEIDDQTAEGKMKSIVRVNGIMNCQALLGLFINTRKICVSNSGPLSGIPPTLLSPTAFHGATLTPISVKQRSSDDSRSQNLVSVDITGPILPHTLFGLMGLFGRVCSHSAGTNVPLVRSSLRTFDHSSSFTLEIGQQKRNSSDSTPIFNSNPTFAVENLEESRLDKRFLSAICTPDRQMQVPLADFEFTSNGIRYNRASHHHHPHGSKRT